MGKTQDFPAAHSMDTDWFAVDADGHVAALFSGEDGEVPVDRGRSIRSLEALASTLDMSWESDLDGATMIGQASTAELFQTHDWAVETYGSAAEWTLENAFLTLGSAEDIPRLEAKGLIRFRGEPPVVFVGESRLDRVVDLLLEDRILAYREAEWEEIARLLGFYQYQCDGYFQHDIPSTPYQQVTTPHRAVTVEDLPKTLRTSIETVRFDTLRFAETPTLHPAEHVPCRRWEDR